MAKLTNSVQPLFNDRDISRWIDTFNHRAEEKMVDLLTYAGEVGVKHARESGRYNDITGNLRSSIGYMVVINGKTVADSFETSSNGSDRNAGVSEARKLAGELKSKFNRGMVLILVAGMDYAVHVEAIDGKDVLTGAVMETEKELRDVIDKVFRDGRKLGDLIQ